MNPKHILSRSVAMLLTLTPFAAHGTADTLSGAGGATQPGLAWGLASNWSLGATPGVGDNVIIAATGLVDVRGSTNGGFKEIQDITFNSTAAVTLDNNSSSTDMLLALNGGRGAGVPLISTAGDFAYAITGLGTNAPPHPLGLQLRASGQISVAANVLTISSVIRPVAANDSKPAKLALRHIKFSRHIRFTGTGGLFRLFHNHGNVGRRPHLRRAFAGNPPGCPACIG